MTAFNEENRFIDWFQKFGEFLSREPKTRHNAHVHEYANHQMFQMNLLLLCAKRGFTLVRKCLET